MIGNYPKVLNFNQSFLKPSRFMCNYTFRLISMSYLLELCVATTFYRVYCIFTNYFISYSLACILTTLNI